MEPLSSDAVKRVLAAEAAQVEMYLASCLNNDLIPNGLRHAMYYSLLAGGKRIRPVLCLLSGRLFGVAVEKMMPFAAAIECIHTYSLIHDDLPAMDDDDLRRGRPSNHKQFDEATAILAGDALLTDAFQFMTAVEQVDSGRLVRAIREMAIAAGSSGMVGGQFLDMQYTARKDITLEELAAMHAMKTGALLRTPCVVGALLGGAGEHELACMARFGSALGSAFQIMDDILDETGTVEELGKPVGSDAASGKVTYPSLLGLEKSLELAKARAEEAIQAIAEISGPEVATLQGLALYVVTRRK